MKLALGSGSRWYGEDWIHVDKGNHPNVKDWDIAKLPLEDESVDLIYCSHLIAYFHPSELRLLLHEWRRVLKYGGTLRLATPNFDKITQLYQAGRIRLSQTLGPLYGHMLMGDIPIAHKTCWDYGALEDILVFSGFKDIRLYDWRETEHANVDDHSQAYIPHFQKDTGVLISLNVEAIK